MTFIANARKALGFFGGIGTLYMVLSWTSVGAAAVFAFLSKVPPYWIPAIMGFTWFSITAAALCAKWLSGLMRVEDNWSAYDFLTYIVGSSRRGKHLHNETAIGSPTLTELERAALIGSTEYLDAVIRLNRQVDELLEPSQRLADDIRRRAHEGTLRVWGKEDRYGAIHQVIDPRTFLDHDFEYLAAYLGSAQREGMTANDLEFKITRADSAGGNAWMNLRFNACQVMLLWPPRSVLGLGYLTRRTPRPIVRA